MHAYQSTGRHKWYAQGYHYIVQFQWASQADRLLFVQIQKEFAAHYGPERYQVINPTMPAMLPQWVHNENWRSEQNRPAKRRRIYLKDGSILSFIMLKIQQ